MKHLVLPLIKRTALLLLFGSPAIAQTTIAGFEVNGLTGYGPSPLPANTSAANVTVGGLTRGSGLTTGGTAAPNTFGANGWNTASASAADAVLANDFFSFTVTVNSGTVDLGQFQFNYQRSGSGPTVGQLQYSTNGTTFTDVATGLFFYTGTSGTVSASLAAITDLQGVMTGTTVVFRIPSWAATSTGGNLYVRNVTGDDLSITEPTPLSTDLLSFTASTSGHTAQLSWTTSCANTIRTFSVEHSNDGQSFASVGRVEAATSECSNSTRAYRFETPAAGGLYRLAMLDASGHTSYSRAIAVSGTAKAVTGIRLYPSPVKATLQAEGMQPGSDCRILDATGRAVLAWTAASEKESIAVSNLPAGTYLFVSENAGSRVAQRFSKN